MSDWPGHFVSLVIQLMSIFVSAWDLSTRQGLRAIPDSDISVETICVIYNYTFISKIRHTCCPINSHTPVLNDNQPNHDRIIWYQICPDIYFRFKGSYMSRGVWSANLQPNVGICFWRRVSFAYSSSKAYSHTRLEIRWLYKHDECKNMILTL